MMRIDQLLLPVIELVETFPQIENKLDIFQFEPQVLVEMPDKLQPPDIATAQADLSTGHAPGGNEFFMLA
jgi:hypothetical protein